MKKKSFFNLEWLLFAVLVLSLISHYLRFFSFEIDEIIMASVAGLATLPVILSALRAVKNKRLTVDLLAAIALVFSLLAREWPSATFINLMLTSARIFADYTDNRARRAINSLLKLKPKKAKIEKNGEVNEIPISEIKKGDFVIVELGEKIPVDGAVLRGEASVDQSSLTGESVPADKKAGEKVFSSTVVVSGNLVVKAEKIGAETMFEKIIDLVEKSLENKAEIHGIADKFASWYIGITLVGALVLYAFSQNLVLVLSVLLVTCADDIAVALPLAFLTTIGYAASRGVIIKGGNFVEGLAKLKIVVVDKTGTLTRGRMKVENIITFGKRKPEEILRIAAFNSYLSNHPSAQAIVNYAREKKITLSEPEKFKEISGKGVESYLNGEKTLTGKLSFFKESKIKIDDKKLEEINRQKEKGLTVNLVGLGEELIGLIMLADELRPKVKETIDELKDLGVEKIVMLTGDNEKIADRIAQEVGIKEFHANLLPEDKLKYIKKYLGPKHKLAMVGDGVNDAAALSLADVGVAMGVIGSDAAIEAADVALMKDDFSVLPEIVEVSKYTMKVGNQDFWIWGIVNAVGLILVFTEVFGPTSASAYNFITDFIPLINSLRIFGFRFSKPLRLSGR